MSKRVEILHLSHEDRDYGPHAVTATPELTAALDRALGAFQQACRDAGAAGAATYLLAAAKAETRMHSGMMLYGRTFDDVPFALTALLASLCGCWGNSGCGLDEVVDRLTKMANEAIELALATRQAERKIPPTPPEGPQP